MAVADYWVRLYPREIDLADDVYRLDSVETNIRVVNVSINTTSIEYIQNDEAFFGSFILNHDLLAPNWSVTDTWGPGGSKAFIRGDSYKNFLFVCTGGSVMSFLISDGDITAIQEKTAPTSATDCAYYNGYLLVCDDVYIRSYRVESDGKLNQVDSLEFVSSFVCIHVNSDFVYAGDSNGYVRVISLDDDGQLNWVSSDLVNSDITDIVSDSQGYVFVAGYNLTGAKLKTYSVDESGDLELVDQSSYLGTETGGLAIDNYLVYMANIGSGLRVFQHTNGNLSSPLTITPGNPVYAVSNWEYYTYVSLGANGVVIYYIEELASMDYKLLKTLSAIDSDWITIVQNKALASDTSGFKLQLIELSNSPYVDTTVTFQPIEAGVYDEEVTYHLSTAQSTALLSCEATCIARVETLINPASLTFEQTQVKGSSQAQISRVLNHGDSNYNITEIKIPDGFNISDEVLPKALESGVLDAIESFSESGFTPSSLVACGKYLVAISDTEMKSLYVDSDGSITEVDSYASVGTTDTDITGEYIDNCLFVCRGGDGLFAYIVDQSSGEITLMDSIDMGGQAKQVTKLDEIIWLANGSRGVDSFKIVSGEFVHLYQHNTDVTSVSGICVNGSNVFIAVDYTPA